MESQRRFTEIRPMANYRDRFVVQSLVGGDTGYGYGRLWAAMGGYGRCACEPTAG
jgi:hypothetical protein